MTFMDWSIIEYILNGDVHIRNLDINWIKRLVTIILPGGNTIFHKLIEKDQDDNLLSLLERSQPDENDIKQIQVYWPFLKNLNGDTPLHIAYKQKDYQIIDILFKYLSGFEPDHHSRFITDLLPQLIQLELPELLPYFKSRQIYNQIYKVADKGIIKGTGIGESSLWLDKSYLFDKTMKKPQKDEVEYKIQTKLIDIPSIYHFHNKHNEMFFKNLSDS